MTPDSPAWLLALPSGRVRWGLETVTELLREVGDPHLGFPSIHIGGTNGKGSVAALCDAALRAAGVGVGLYTSPHLVRFHERIRIDGAPVADRELAAATHRLRPAVERTGASFFEASTALAFLLFAEAGVQIATVEVGLGGRLDATNVLRPAVTGLTNVARDHTEYLGATLPEIAAEKAGIFKPGVPAVVGETDPAALRVLRERAAEVGAPFAALDDIAQLGGIASGPEGVRFRLGSRAWGERELSVSLPGIHQARNAALAAELLARLPGPLRPEWRVLEEGFVTARWPGRLQRERIGSTVWLFDVAHNPAGAETLAEALPSLRLPRPWVLLFGVLADKEWGGMLPPLLARVNAALLTVPPTAPASRRWDPAAAAAALAPPPGVALRVIPHFAAALGRATTLAPHGTVIVTGSVHTVGDAFARLGIPVA